MIASASFFNAYRKITKSLEGSGLSKIKFVREAHKKLMMSLTPEIVQFNGFRLKHLGSLDSGSDLFLKTMKENIQNGDLVVDVGASIGYYTFYMSRFVGSGCVYAFEPEPTKFEVLKENRKLNDFKNVMIEQKAVYDKNDFVFLDLTEGINHRVSNHGIKVESVTLDDYFKDRTVNFIKLDAEGSERKILLGMKRILENPNLKMITEFYYKLLDDPLDYFERLEQRFKLYDLRDNLKPVSKIEFFKKYNDKSGATDLLCLKIQHDGKI